MPVGPVKLGVLDAGAFFGAGVPGRAAVFHVAAAHRVRRWTAAPGSGRSPAAGFIISATGLVIALDVFVLCWAELGFRLK